MNKMNLWLERIVQSRQIYIQQEEESQRRFHLSLMDRRPVCVRGIDRRLMKRKNEAQHLRTDLSEMQNCAKDYLTVNL